MAAPRVGALSEEGLVRRSVAVFALVMGLMLPASGALASEGAPCFRPPPTLWGTGEEICVKPPPT